MHHSPFSLTQEEEAQDVTWGESPQGPLSLSFDYEGLEGLEGEGLEGGEGEGGDRSQGGRKRRGEGLSHMSYKRFKADLENFPRSSLMLKRGSDAFDALVSTSNFGIADSNAKKGSVEEETKYASDYEQNDETTVNENKFQNSRKSTSETYPVQPLQEEFRAHIPQQQQSAHYHNATSRSNVVNTGGDFCDSAGRVSKIHTSLLHQKVETGMPCSPQFSLSSQVSSQPGVVDVEVDPLFHRSGIACQMSSLSSTSSSHDPPETALLDDIEAFDKIVAMAVSAKRLSQEPADKHVSCGINRTPCKPPLPGQTKYDRGVYSNPRTIGLRKTSPSPGQQKPAMSIHHNHPTQRTSYLSENAVNKTSGGVVSQSSYRHSGSSMGATAPTQRTSYPSEIAINKTSGGVAPPSSHLHSGSSMGVTNKTSGAVAPPPSHPHSRSSMSVVVPTQQTSLNTISNKTSNGVAPQTSYRHSGSSMSVVAPTQRTSYPSESAVNKTSSGITPPSSHLHSGSSMGVVANKTSGAVVPPSSHPHSGTSMGVVANKTSPGRMPPSSHLHSGSSMGVVTNKTSGAVAPQTSYRHSGSSMGVVAPTQRTSYPSESAVNKTSSGVAPPSSYPHSRSSMGVVANKMGGVAPPSSHPHSGTSMSAAAPTQQTSLNTISNKASNGVAPQSSYRHSGSSMGAAAPTPETAWSATSNKTSGGITPPSSHPRSGSSMGAAAPTPETSWSATSNKTSGGITPPSSHPRSGSSMGAAAPTLETSWSATSNKTSGGITPPSSHPRSGSSMGAAAPTPETSWSATSNKISGGITPPSSHPHSGSSMGVVAPDQQASYLLENAVAKKSSVTDVERSSPSRSRTFCHSSSGVAPSNSLPYSRTSPLDDIAEFDKVMEMTLSARRQSQESTSSSTSSISVHHCNSAPCPGVYGVDTLSEDAWESLAAMEAAAISACRHRKQHVT